MKKLLPLVLALSLAACTTIKYVPIKGETIVKDSLIIETRIDTIEVKLPAERVRDWTGLLDTLRLETGLATSTTWVDTTKGILAGELKNKETPVEVYVPSTSKLEVRDSLVYVEKPIEIPIETEVKVYPRWMIVLSLLGVVSTLILGFGIYLRLKKKTLKI